MGFSTYSGNKLIDLLLRGVAFAAPTEIWMSLHTADPGNTGASEVGIGAWPAYLRVQPSLGAAIATGFNAAAAKATVNAKDLLFPRHDGAGNVTVSHVGFWDAVAAGNLIKTGVIVDLALTPTPKVLSPTDEVIFYAGEILVSVT